MKTKKNVTKAFCLGLFLLTSIIASSQSYQDSLRKDNEDIISSIAPYPSDVREAILNVSNYHQSRQRPFNGKQRRQKVHACGMPMHRPCGTTVLQHLLRAAFPGSAATEPIHPQGAADAGRVRLRLRTCVVSTPVRKQLHSHEHDSQRGRAYSSLAHRSTMSAKS